MMKSHPYKFELSEFLSREDVTLSNGENDARWLIGRTEDHDVSLEQGRNGQHEVNVSMRLVGKTRKECYYLTSTIYRDRNDVMQDVQIRREGSDIVHQSKSKIDAQEVPDNDDKANRLMFDLYLRYMSLWYTIAVCADTAGE
jgi:hypothetical protein